MSSKQVSTARIFQGRLIEEHSWEAEIFQDWNCATATGVTGVSIIKAGSRYFVARYNRPAKKHLRDSGRQYDVMNYAKNTCEARYMFQNLVENTKQMLDSEAA